MELPDIELIQKSIGYTFKNPLLLQQAFVRRSFAIENGCVDNEILEFVGDKALDLAVIKILCKNFGNTAAISPPIASEQFLCLCTEGELTELKKNLVKRESLCKCVSRLNFAKYLVMGKGEIKNNADAEMSVREDLFEAILGAVTLDCCWNLDTIETVVENLLGITTGLKSYTPAKKR